MTLWELLRYYDVINYIPCHLFCRVDYLLPLKLAPKENRDKFDYMISFGMFHCIAKLAFQVWPTKRERLILV